MGNIVLGGHHGAIKSNQCQQPCGELFVQLFCEVFGPEKTENLQVQYPCVDIYGRHRYIDFALESPESKIAIEIDGETYHNPSKVSENKYADDLLKQNSLIYDNWKVYRWIYSQLEKQPEKVKDELITFLGTSPMFKAFEADLPVQMGQTIELRDYQQEATKNLQKMREDGKTIALLYHATGVGKTITAATDAKAVGGRTLFLVNALKLASQAQETFAKVWPEATLGEYTGSQKDMTQTVIFATVQSISKDLEKFSPTDFDYLIVDECHHAAANTYQKIFTYFHPKFILGLTATPERSDGEDMLELFQNVAHKMDLKTAVERGILVPIRCVRVKTNIDLTDVRINGIKYNSQDLESKLFIPERNQLIVDTYLRYVNGKKTVIFCASVDHAAEIAKLLRDNGVKAEAVSGRDRVEVREKILKDYETGSTNVLCACDLLNEGWDSPHTTVLFMARPTMSKTIYLQQLGRGTRRCPGKEDLLVVDFVDNANMFNMPYSLHRVLDIAKYQPMAYVLAPENKRKLDQDMLFQGEKPEAWLDVPIDVSDYEIIDLFNWQNSVKDMISQIEFVRMVDVQSETVERYIKDGKVKPDLSIPFGDKRMFHYFREESIRNIAKQYGWDLITPQNMADKFMKFIETMDMSYSYKPVLLKAIYEYMDTSGRVALPDVVDYFIDFYEDRKAHGMIAEKSTSIYQKGGYTRKDVEKNILSNPFKRFEDMRFLMRCKDVETIEVNPIIFRKLTREDWLHIVDVCDKSLEKYYLRLKK
jgi:DNA or RNA helicases of superfamily II